MQIPEILQDETPGIKESIFARAALAAAILIPAHC